MTKIEIMEAIEYNTELIAKLKTEIKKVEKAKALLNEVGVNAIHAENALVELNDQLAMHINYLAKRKRQLKLIEAAEALDDDEAEDQMVIAE